MPAKTILMPVTAFVIILAMVAPGQVLAHCDTLDGPVVQAARLALKQKDVTPVLKWVRKQDEQAITAAFEQTLAVREKGDRAQELADRYFFETLVRVHRAGEGAPFTGLKPAGAVHPAIAAADKALETASVDVLADKIAAEVHENIRRRFTEARAKMKHADDSVEDGREFVEAYIEYVHFVEGIHDMLEHGAAHHADVPAGAGLTAQPTTSVAFTDPKC